MFCISHCLMLLHYYTDPDIKYRFTCLIVRLKKCFVVVFSELHINSSFNENMAKLCDLKVAYSMERFGIVFYDIRV